MEGWSLYFKQQMWLAALSVSLLHLTVLSLGLLMTAYLKWQGLSEAELSLKRGCGAMCGLIATCVLPILQQASYKLKQ